MKVLLLDNYDSFTWNLQHYLSIAGLETEIVRNNEASADVFFNESYSGLVIGPGPCTPTDAGSLFELMDAAWLKMPILGICLGHQAIAERCGWKLIQAKAAVHGKARTIEHSGYGIFKNIPNPMQVGRYHSLIVEQTLPNSELEIHAHCDGEVMAIKHVELPIWGVQFHPESILTPDGQALIDNWVLTLNL
jgi:anthranilate synthase component 2